MTKEKTKTCEKLAEEYADSIVSVGHCETTDELSIYKDGVEHGFKAAQSPEMLMLNPLVKGLVEAGHQHMGYINHMLKRRNEVGKDKTDNCAIQPALDRFFETLAPFKEDV